jgi:hypothetical protein
MENYVEKWEEGKGISTAAIVSEATTRVVM